MKQRFTYPLHDGRSSYERREHIEGEGITLPEEAWENMGRPFYEVILHCEVDEKGEVSILSVVT